MCRLPHEFPVRAVWGYSINSVNSRVSGPWGRRLDGMCRAGDACGRGRLLWAGWAYAVAVPGGEASGRRLAGSGRLECCGLVTGRMVRAWLPASVRGTQPHNTTCSAQAPPPPLRTQGTRCKHNLRPQNNKILAGLRHVRAA